MKQPSRLVQDDDGHWYIVPITELESFYDWLNAVYTHGSYSDNKFSDYIINGVHTLTLYDWTNE